MADPTTILTDQPQRDRLLGADASDLGRSFAVEAGAGSGKTTALIGRLLALVEAGEAQLPAGLSEVVAITFTRKAAAELRAQAYRRFVARASDLAAALDNAASEADRDDAALRLQRVRAALAELDAACIDTIHGFCGRLLRADALAVGVPPDFTVIEDREADDLRRAFWRRYVHEQHERPDASPAASSARATASTTPASLDTVGLGPGDVEALFAALIRHADRLPTPYGASCPDLVPAVEKALEKVKAWQALRPNPPLGPRDTVQSALDTAERLHQMQGLDTPLDRARFLAAVMNGYDERGDKGKVTLNRWAESRTPEYARAKELRDEEVPALAATVRPVLKQWEAYVYDAALAYARGAVEAFATERRRDGTLTFDDVLQLTADLLRHAPAARRRATARYRRFFVDEFQDTDPVQAEVLLLLAAENADETEWRRCRPRTGSLFLVGDPKQSIYRFRRADIETYDEARRMLGDNAQLQLASCFRSVPDLCAWINGQLRRPFGDDREQDGGERRQAHYTDLRSARPAGPANRPAGPAVARILVGAIKGHGADNIAAQDADAIAAFIRAAVDAQADPALYEQPDDRARPEAFGEDKATVFGPQARYGDFLVLSRAATRFSIYAAAFEQLGIPYALAGDKGLGNADELRALVDLLDAVRDPLDGVALAAHRTGLLGGLDAPTLYGLHVSTLDGDEDRARAAEIADDVLEAARHTLATLPLSAALERIVTDSGLLAWAARRQGGSDRAGGLVKLIALARRWEADGLHWTEALDHLRDLRNGETTDGRITLEEGTRDAVRIMTVHQAKGLQAPVVFLADPYSSFNPKPDEHAGRDERGEPFATVPLARPHQFGSTIVAAPRCWYDGHAEEAAHFEEAEAHRLVYVAATRARGLLVVSQYAEKTGEGSWGDLHAGLDAAPELETLIVQRSTARVPAEVPLDGGSERRRAALARAARPSFVARAVSDRAVSDRTSEADPAPDYDPTDEEGHTVAYGSAYGTAVHQLFEWAIRNRDAGPMPEAEEALAARLWEEHGVRYAPVAHALEALTDFRASSLWARIAEADEVHAEIPIAGTLTAAGAGGDGRATAASISYRGTVDLAFRDADGWHLVDYKTDADAVGEALGPCALRHTEQLATYAELWETATGAAPTSTSLWFTASATLCSL